MNSQTIRFLSDSKNTDLEDFFSICVNKNYSKRWTCGINSKTARELLISHYHTDTATPTTSFWSPYHVTLLTYLSFLNYTEPHEGKILWYIRCLLYGCNIIPIELIPHTSSDQQNKIDKFTGLVA